MEHQSTSAKIHAAIVQAMKDIAETGIAKAQKNKQQGYNYRGIEDAMNEMSPILTRNGITITPSYSELNIAVLETASGGRNRFATVKGSFKFEVEDGSFIVAEAYGEGMDVSDKATTKAQSVAFRTVLFQQFVVPFMAIDPEDDGGDVGQSPQSTPNAVQSKQTTNTKNKSELHTRAAAAFAKGQTAYMAFFAEITQEERQKLGNDGTHRGYMADFRKGGAK